MRSIVRASALLTAAVTLPLALAVGCKGATDQPKPTKPKPVAAAVAVSAPPVVPLRPPVADLWPLVDATSSHYMHDAIVLVAPLVGDDNADGVIREEESGFNCRTMGNGYCGL